MCKYGLLYLVAFAIPVLRVQLHFVNCINKRKKKKKKKISVYTGTIFAIFHYIKALYVQIMDLYLIF